MAFWNKFPYSDFHRLNLDWIISKFESIMESLSGKQDTLVSGSNIKTINGNSLLGSGNLTISGGGGAVDSVNGQTGTVTLDADDVGALASSALETTVSNAYVSGTNYAIGDYVIYNTTLYKCIAATDGTIVPTDTNYWDDVTVAEELQKKQDTETFELIESRTLASDTTTEIDITTTPGGDTYNYKSLMLFITLPKEYTAPATIIAIDGGGTRMTMAYLDSSSSTVAIKYAKVFFINVGGIYMAQSYGFSHGGGARPSIYPNHPVSPVLNQNINKLVILPLSSGILPAGTTFEIYGIEA